MATKIKRSIKVSTRTKVFKVEGVPDIMKTLRAIAATLGGEQATAFTARISEACLKPAIMIRDDAIAKAPEVSGRLKASIYAAVLEGHVGAVVGTRKCYYAPWVEYGTEHNTKKPFMRPALKAMRPKFAPLLAADLTQIISDVAAANAKHPAVAA